jgi:RNA recognition motif-containing protein
MNIYVGNISYKMTDEELRDLFAAHGEVNTVKIIKDWDTGRSKGFGFVEMNNDDEAKAALEALEGQEISGRTLRVSEARSKNQ